MKPSPYFAVRRNVASAWPPNQIGTLPDLGRGLMPPSSSSWNSPLKRDVRLGPQRLHEAHLLLGALAAGVEVHAQALELDLVPADADAQAEAALAQRVEAGRLLGHQRRLALRQDQHAGGKADLARDAGQEGEQHEGIVIGRGGGADAAPAIILGRIDAEHVIGRDEIVEAQPLGRLRIVAQDGRAGADVADRQ